MASRYSPTLGPCGDYQPAVLFKSKLLEGISHSAELSPLFLHPLVSDSPHESKQWLRKDPRSKPPPNSKTESEKERASPLGSGYWHLSV